MSIIIIIIIIIYNYIYSNHTVASLVAGTLSCGNNFAIQKSN